MARKRARENPLKTRDKVLIGVGGAAFLAGILYFATRPKGVSGTTNVAAPQQPSGEATLPSSAAAPGETAALMPKIPRWDAGDVNLPPANVARRV